MDEFGGTSVVLRGEDIIYETIGGFIITTMGKVPEKGEKIFYNNIGFKVKERVKTHVISVEIELPQNN